MKTISTPKAPAAIGPYSQAKVVNGMLYASGQIPINPATGDVDATTIEGQTEQVIANIAAVLEEAGSKNGVCRISRCCRSRRFLE